MYVIKYVCMYVCMYVCVGVCVCILYDKMVKKLKHGKIRCVCLNRCMYVCMFVCMFVCVCVYCTIKWLKSQNMVKYVVYV